MKLSIAQNIFEKFPDFIAGVIITRGIDNSGGSDELLQLCRSIEPIVSEQFAQLENPGRHPLIEPWRRAYRTFGVDPQRYRCSSEALTRQVIKGNDVWGINKLVDTYNYVSLKYTLPVGGEDLAKMIGDLELAFARGDEPFIRLGGTESEPPQSGEVVYRDNVGVICRMWNWREGDRTKLTEETKSVVIVIDALAPADQTLVTTAARELVDLVTQFCGGNSTMVLLDRNQTACML